MHEENGASFSLKKKEILCSPKNKDKPGGQQANRSTEPDTEGQIDTV